MNEEYRKAIIELYNSPSSVSPRGFKTKELLGYVFQLNNPIERIVTLEGMKTSIEYATAELIWYLSGTDCIDDLPEKYRKIWQDFSDDGIHVNSAYGYRIFGNHPKFLNQFSWCVKKLKEDKDSRQAVININSVIDKFSPTKDFPCCISTQYFIRNDRLYNIVNFRSQDVNKGLRNDVFTLTGLQELMALKLNLEMGQFTMMSNSLHLYESDFERASKVIDAGPKKNAAHKIDWDYVESQVGDEKSRKLGWSII